MEIGYVAAEIQPSGYNVSTSESLDKQSLTQHLAELRSCLVISLAAVAAGFAAAYSCIRPIADWFFRPLVQVLPENKTLIFISYQEGFFFI
jgi:sec-independent protein translocase protein TatC